MAPKKSNTKRAARKCAYCGDIATTKDHVPPKSLFPSPRPSNLVTVPSCRRCNEEGGKDDEYFRQVILLRDDLSSHPQAARVLSVELRAFANPRRKGLSRALVNRVREAEVESPSGILIGKQLIFNVDMPRLARVASRSAQGLLFSSSGKRVPDGYVAVGIVHPGLRPPTIAARYATYDAQFAQQVARMRTLPRIEIGTGVFAYHLARSEADSGVSWMLLEFYETIHVFVETVPESSINTERFSTYRKYVFPYRP